MIAQLGQSPWTLVTNPEEWGVYLNAVSALPSEEHPRFPFLVTEECDRENGDHLFVTMNDAVQLMVASIGLAKADPPRGDNGKKQSAEEPVLSQGMGGGGDAV